MYLAEREGFEPPVRFTVQLISSQPHSTTLPPLQGGRSIHYRIQISARSSIVEGSVRVCHNFGS